MDVLLEHPLPSDVEAERLLLGVVILMNEQLEVVREHLASPDDFFLTSHRLIYEAMLDIARANRLIDPLTLQDELRRRNQLDKVGGPVAIAGLFDGVPRFSNIENYCRLVASAALRRRMVKLFNEYMHLAVKSEHEADELLELAQRAVMGLQPIGRKEQWATMSELSEQFLQKLELMQEQNRPLTGLATGFGKLDALTGGLQPGTLMLLAARPSIGKSALSMNIADGAATSELNDGAIVGVYSLEMTADELSGRYLAMKGSVDQQAFKTGRLGKGEWKSLLEASAQPDLGRVYVDDRPSLTTLEMRANARRLRARHNRLDLIIVDYLQIVRSSERGESRYRQLGLIAEDLKAMGKEFACPVIAVTALGREAEDHEPTLKDLRESGDLEFVADLVCFLHGGREDEVLKFIMAKQRGGPLGRFDLVFQRQWSRFAEHFGNYA